MKIRTKIAGILFLVVACLVCSSCEKDNDVDLQPIQLQYAIYNDQPNPVSNNKIDLDFPCEHSTDLVIFGGDGQYSVMNTDDAKLKINCNNESLKLTPLASGNTTVTIKDGHDNIYTLNVQIKKRFRLNINVKEDEGNIFDLMEFNLYAYSENKMSLLDLTETYDSIVWLCTNTNQRFQVLEDTGNSTRFTWQWSNCFFLPAIYETCLLGYKDNEIISADTAILKIEDKKDFLGYNWNEVVNSDHSTGYHSVFMKDATFSTFTEVTEGVPSISLFFFNSTDDDAAFAQKSEQMLLDYISSLYSSPKYSQSEENSLSDIYNGLFNNKKEGEIPEYIWVTEKSKIALLKKQVGLEYPEYEIYAESSN